MTKDVVAQLQDIIMQPSKIKRLKAKHSRGNFRSLKHGNTWHMRAEISQSRCLQNCMTKDVVAQLQKISTQQSKIKTLKGKLAVYQDVANKQAETFAELQLVKRVPVAYRHCLAECMRRYAPLQSLSSFL